MTGPQPDVVVEPDAEHLARAVAEALVARLAAAQAVHGTASVVLTGGGVGTAVLEHVAAAGRRAGARDRRLDGGRRLVGRRAVRPGRRRRAEREGRPPRPARRRRCPGDRGCTRCRRPTGEFAEPEDAAAWYAGELAAAAPEGADLPRFDVLLLGMGPEGHVASIFPDSPAVSDERPVFAVRDCPKPPPTRVSLGFRCDQQRRGGLAAGVRRGQGPRGRRRPLRRRRRRSNPAAGVHGRRATRWLLDRAAAGKLPQPPG